jgi:hypothetical protein
MENESVLQMSSNEGGEELQCSNTRMAATKRWELEYISSDLFWVMV